MDQSWDDHLASKAFDVEHALGLLVGDSFIMPGRVLYEPERLQEYSELLSRCHIYVIGHLPVAEMDKPGQMEGDDIITSWLIAGKPYQVRTKIDPPGCTVLSENGRWWIVDPNGHRVTPHGLREMALKQLGDEQNAMPFKVLYIGQAFGKDGSRAALDRLLPGHEKLQEIAMKGPPAGHALYLLLIHVDRDTQLMTVFNPKAKNKNDTKNRILQGMEKLEQTTEAEKTTLYEASLIRYFKPPYNKEYKENFPSTNMTVLKNCYAKDINAIIAEVNIDGGFQLTSDDVPPLKHHVISHNLHTEEERKVFFDL